MRRPVRAQRYSVIATAAGVTILVTLALTVLGWRQLSQEEAVEKQRRRDGLELAADRWLSRFVRLVDQYGAILRQADSLDSDDLAVTNPALIAETAGQAILLRLSSNGVQTRPEHRLIYHPTIPDPAPLDARFEQIDGLEFQSGNLDGAARLLAMLSRSGDVHTRAEALLRLGRVHSKRKNRAGALAAYRELDSFDSISRAEVPYALLSRYARCRLHSDAGSPSEAAQEAGALLAALHSGRWPVRKETYLHYTSAVRALANSSLEPAPERLALSEAAEILWADWQASARGEPFLQRRLHSSAGHALVLVSHPSPDRLLAVAVPWTSIVSHPDFPFVNDDTSLTVMDPHDQPVVGSRPAPGDVQIVRTLAAAGMPGTLYFRSSDSMQFHSWRASRRAYLIFGLGAVAAIVAVACYAMARGLLRELEVRVLQTDFVSAVSHEFRSPLTALGQMTELLADDRVVDERSRRLYLDVMQSETSRLGRLVENLLDFGRMQANRRHYEQEPFDFTELVRDTVRDYGEEVQRDGYSLELSGDHAPTLVAADREAFRSVIRNLLENAVKYSPDSRTVWIETGRQNGDVVLNVRDRGIGVPANEQRRIFDRFVRGEAAKRACIQGTGIGLAMVREIVEAHHGRVTLTSEPGVGSTFAVQVPLIRTSLSGA